MQNTAVTPAAGSAMPLEPIRDRSRRAAEKKTATSPSPTSRTFDLPGPVPLRRSYIVASSPRCGSVFLCTRLWATGVLGAPAEYFGFHKRVGARMMKRLEASLLADYLGKLLACRTSKNGIFGVNVDFNDFEEALRQFPETLSALSPVTYIYVDRRDKLVQAAFMAKAVQADAQLSEQKSQAPALRYDRDLISKWLGRIERQRVGWLRWFESKSVEPFVVDYEKLTAETADVVRSIVALLGAQSDKPQKVRIALVEKPSDRTSEDWAARFNREVQTGIAHGETDATVASPRSSVATDGAKPSTEGHRATGKRKDAHIFDRYDEASNTVVRPIAAMRLRRRYEAIIARNRGLFENARVLDLHSGDGRWSLAALDAGAAYVVGVESQREQVEAAGTVFTKMGIKSASYRFVGAKIFAALATLKPDAFDLILCREFSSDPHFFFNCLHRLRPKHVVLDTKVAGRKTPIIAFRLKRRDMSNAPGRPASIRAIPNHELIRTLCDCFAFGWRIIDWRALVTTDWTGVRDYQRDARRTYVLDRIGQSEPGRAS